MGVHGLTTYILSNAKLYLKPYELSDCCVIVDGNSVAHSLFKEIKSHNVFGGDYDEYFTLVKSFMLALKKCNISPIVLFDGGCEKSKIKTRINRRHTAVLKLKSFSQGFSTEKFYPLFFLDVFLNATREIGFTFVQCDVEADGEIATVARELNCPVLSYDSDYFIYDVLYIPFNTMKLSPIKYSNSNKYYLECSIYNVNEFLKTINIDKSLLPILVILLGNDYVENGVFSKFFNHVRIPEAKHKSRNQKRIYGLMLWLKNENLNSAVKHILSHLKDRDADKVLKLLNKAINDYKTSMVSEAVLSELKNKFVDIKLLKKDSTIKCPPEIAKLFAQGFIPGFIKNMVLHHLWLTPVQVEDMYEDSSHIKSLILIRKIYTMLIQDLYSEKPLNLYLRIKKQYTNLKIDINACDKINLDKSLKEPWETRLKLLCDIVGIPMNDLKFVPCNSWAVFMMSFIFWAKEFRDSVSLCHIHAFVIMIIANKIIQPKVGYFRNTPEFMKRQGDKLAKLKGTKITLEESSSFKEMLQKVTDYECFLIQKDLIPLRRTTEEGSKRGFCITTIHLFNSFQSCLFHIMIINALLNNPLPHLNIEEFYSGTLLFNLYVHIKSKPNVEKFGSILFLNTPNLNQIYKYLSDKLSKLLEKTEIKTRERRRKRKKKKKSFSLNVLENTYYSTDNEEFSDENNIYGVLFKIKDLS